jgi:hypothetical protein
MRNNAPRFVVYHIKSTMQKAAFYREFDAKKLVAKLGEAYAYAPIADYHNKVVYMVTKVNMMSGKEYQEPSNTPNYLSPASEAYWSM